MREENNYFDKIILNLSLSGDPASHAVDLARIIHPDSLIARSVLYRHESRVTKLY